MSRTTGLQRIDDRIAGDKNPLGWHRFLAQILSRRFGGGKMQIGESPDEDAIDFLREGGESVAGAEAGLDMADGNPLVEGRECRRHRPWWYRRAPAPVRA